MKKISCVATLLVAFVLAMWIPGCDMSNDPSQNVAEIATSIRIGASAATSLGLLAIPDADEADEIGELALGVMEDSILPLLDGDEEGLVSGLEKLLDLSVFDNPKLEKLRLVLETALPLLRKHIPDNLVDQGLDKLPENVKAYLKAFFRGINDGLEAYLGDGDRGSRSSSRFEYLRKKLAE